jgi:hypothetical protein
MPVVIKITSEDIHIVSPSFFLLQNHITYIKEENILQMRELGNNINIKKFIFKNKYDINNVFNFLMELLKTNPAVIVDMKSLTENTDEYINNFYEKKNQ